MTDKSLQMTCVGNKNTLRARRFVAAVLAFVMLSMIVPSVLTGQNPKPTPISAKSANQNSNTTPDAAKGPTGPKAESKKKRPLPPIEPQIPRANRNNKARVFLEKADLMFKTEIDTFIIVTGNVEFSHGATLMYCDSAHFYPGSESLDAFGNVRMRQGDTLFIYAEELNYSGSRHMAYLYGNGTEPVRMINRDVTLRTPTFIYDLAADFGYYNEGGELTDKKNRLTSKEGEYVPSTKDASFFRDVVLQSRQQSDTLMIYSDTLFYNTNTHIAILESPSTIVNSQATIYTDYGTYNTDNALANLYNRSKVVASTGATLEGDTLFYDRNKGFGEAFGNMEIVDTAHSVILTGDYGYYNEVIDSAFASGNALAREYSQGDTLYLHGEYLYGYSVTDTIHIPEDTIAGIPESFAVDTSYVMIAHPRVRFYREDVQGICDSMRFEQKDSMLYMFHHPIVWSDDRQIWGNIIKLHFNDSTVERATLPDFGFTAEHIEDKYYNQLSGKELIAYFNGGELYQVDVNGNVQAIMLPQENDSTFNKIVNVESSFLIANFEKQKITKAKMWPETNGTVTPLYLAKKSLFYLPKFQWYVDMRPTSPYDVMVIPPSMEELMSDIKPTSIKPKRISIVTDDDGTSTEVEQPLTEEEQHITEEEQHITEEEQPFTEDLPETQENTEISPNLSPNENLPK